MQNISVQIVPVASLDTVPYKNEFIFGWDLFKESITELSVSKEKCQTMKISPKKSLQNTRSYIKKK
jgi:hypothetical protein